MAATVRAFPSSRTIAIDQQQHTPGHLNCLACELTRILGMQIKLSPTLSFKQAADLWLEGRTLSNGTGRARYIATGTLRSYQEYIKSLNRFFADLPLNKVHCGHLRQYQLMRSNGQLGTPEGELLKRLAKHARCTVEQLKANAELRPWVQQKIDASHRPVSPNKINQEIGTIIAILKRADLWTSEREDEFEHLQREESDLPRALTPQEQLNLLEVAASHEEFRLVYLYMLIALRTTLTNCEMRHLRMGDVDAIGGRIYVQAATAKNKFRIRTVALAPDAQWAAQQLVERAKGLGSSGPQHYLFPIRVVRNYFDPTRAMSNSGVKKPWELLRRAAGVPWLRIHDLRHTAITRLAESGTPIPVIMSMAGHMSRRMLQHYTQISEHAQRAAIQAAYSGTIYRTEPQPQKRPPVTAIRSTRYPVDNYSKNSY
jgi:integrase